MKIEYIEDATPINQDELKDLIPIHISNQEQLNMWEEANILASRRWAYKQKEILSVAFIKELHKNMFNLTWRWAGTFRSCDKNLGISWVNIATEVKKLCDD